MLHQEFLAELVQRRGTELKQGRGSEYNRRNCRRKEPTRKHIMSLWLLIKWNATGQDNVWRLSNYHKKMTNLTTKKTSHSERWLWERKKQSMTLSQEEPEQIGSFKNSRWEIPACSSRKLPVNGTAKVPAQRSGIIPRLGSASPGNSLCGGDGLFKMQ